MVQCYFCDFTFLSVTQFRVHLLCSHGELLLKGYFCGELNCFRKYSSWNSLRSHLLSSHNFPDRVTETVQNVICTPCDERVIEEPGCYPNMERDEEKPPVFSLAEFYSSVKKSSEIFVAKLYAANALPRNFVQNLIEDVSTFLNSACFQILEEKVLNLLSLSESSELSEVRSMFNAVKEPFKELATDHQRMTHFENSGHYVPPIPYIISESRPKVMKTCNDFQVQNVKTTGQFIPLRLVLKNLFQLPGAFSETLNYMDSLRGDSNVISNVIQGHVWQSKLQKYSKTDIVFPLFFYFDEVEANNPLGPHSEKLGAGYVQVPVLPPYCSSKLENMFLVILFDADDRKSLELGQPSYNENVFRPLIKELNFLEKKGIVCKTDLGSKRIFFVLALSHGDNLGLHGIHGFAEGFSCNFPCIICKAPKEVTQCMTLEDADLFRNPENYATDVLVNNVSETGIKERCVFNSVDSFHITENKVVDSMHDLAEGVSHYVLIVILKHCIDLKYFTVDCLNTRLALFEYGSADSSNKPPCIRDDFFTKSKLKLTAREMITLVRVLGVVIGDRVPASDEYWKLYLLHKQFMEFSQAKHLPSNASHDVSLFVHEHHCLYIKLTKRPMPPKFHYCLHYGTVLQAFGPVSHFSSMRGEAKHRHLTKYVHSISSRRNLPLSAATKHQLMLSFRFASRSPIKPEVICGPGEEFELSDHCEYEFFKNSLPSSLRKEDLSGVNFVRCCRTNWVEYMGTKYESKMVLVLGPDNLSGFVFGKIVDIFMFESQPLFVCSVLDCIGYNDHVGAYEVAQGKMCKCVFHSELFDPFPVLDCSMSTGESSVVLKHYL